MNLYLIWIKAEIWDVFLFEINSMVYELKIFLYFFYIYVDSQKKEIDNCIFVLKFF